MTYLGEHPAEARHTDSSATATLERGLRIKVDGPSGERIFTDMPTSVGGTASAPSPGWLFRAGVQELELSRLEVFVDSDLTMATSTVRVSDAASRAIDTSLEVEAL